jgi:hypothetical protein
MTSKKIQLTSTSGAAGARDNGSPEVASYWLITGTSSGVQKAPRGLSPCIPSPGALKNVESRML